MKAGSSARRWHFATQAASRHPGSTIELSCAATDGGWSDFKAPGMGLYSVPYLAGLDSLEPGVLTDNELRTAGKRLLWTQTIMAVYAVEGLAKGQDMSFRRLPDRAFSGKAGRDRVRLLLAEIQSQGYNERTDSQFAEIAALKKNDNWVAYLLLPRTWQFLQVVFHTRTNNALLMHLTDWSNGPRRVLLGSFHFVKILTVFLWMLAFVVFYARYRKRVLDSLDWFGLLLATVAILKYAAVYIGVAITHAGPEGRLLLGGLPAIQGPRYMPRLVSPFHGNRAEDIVHRFAARGQMGKNIP